MGRPAGGKFRVPKGPHRLGPSIVQGTIATPVALVLVADPGSFTVTGAGAGFAVAMPAAAASFAVTGSASGFAVTLPVSAASYTLTGSSTGFAIGELDAAASYSITGSGAGFAVSLAADAGAYTISGSASYAVAVSAAAGAYSLTSSGASFAVALTASSGAYTASGSAGIAITLGADPGAYVIAGSATLAAGGGQTLNADPGAFAISGTATLQPGAAVPSSQGSFGAGIGGSPHPPLRSKPVTFKAKPASFTIEGSASFKTTKPRKVKRVSKSGVYQLPSAQAEMLRVAALSANAGQIVLAGSASFGVNRVLPADTAALQISGAVEFEATHIDWIAYDNEFLLAA